MLVIFTSNAHSDIMMFSDVAEKLIEMMGHSGTMPGAIAAKDVLEVLERLQKALAFHEKESPDAHQHDDEENKEIKVGLASRAFPLIEMLKDAAKAKEPVMWHQK
jgi:hypothetical protein